MTSKKPRILAVDDEPVMVSFIRDTLEPHGFDVQTASNAEEALALFRASPFDLVITDLRMPGMRGDRLASGIKSISPTVPVVLLTGSPPELVERAQTADVDAIIYKPFKPEEIFSHINRLLLPSPSKQRAA